MTNKIEISPKTIIFTLGLLVLIWFVIQIGEIILLLLVSLILVSALHSPIVWLAEKKIPRPLSILFFYLLFFGICGGGIALLIPPLAEQTKTLVLNIPYILESVNKIFLYQLPVNDLIKSAGGVNFVSENFFKYTWGFFGNIATLVTLLVFTFYLLLRWDNLGNFFSAALGHEERFTRLINRIESELGNWVRGELLLMLIIGVMSYVGLTLLGIPYALPLAILAGLLEIVPLIGPVISSIPAIIITLAISPLLALAVVALYFLIHQLENSLIVPKVMEKAVGLDPLAIILALMIGTKLMGILGTLLAVPITLLVKIIVTDLYKKRG